MAIENVVPSPQPNTGWLEVDPKWIANFWHLDLTGDVTVVLGKIRIGIRSPHIQKGQIVHGFGTMAFVPTGIGSPPDSPWGSCS